MLGSTSDVSVPSLAPMFVLLTARPDVDAGAAAWKPVATSAFHGRSLERGSS